jgi:opacity protein-like surface antigen
MNNLPTVSPSGALKPTFFLGWLVWLAITLAPGLARADVGMRVGPQAGAALSDDVDPYVGLSLRLTAPSSPLTLQPSFEYVFDENQTLYHVGANVLYELPTAFRLRPYLGVGAAFSAFALNQEGMSGDSQGYRLGMSLLAGARLELPWISPFVQVTKRISALDAFTVGGGVELTLREREGAPSAPEPMRFAVTPYLANNLVGDVQPGRVGLGLSLAWLPWEHFGFELDGQLHGHFFRDEDVAGLVTEEGVDLDTSAALLSGSGVFRYCASSLSYGTWCPYATAGVGAIHAWFQGAAKLPGATSISTTQTNLALTTGIGLTHSFTRHVGFRVDGRYFRAIVDEDARQGGYFEDYGFLRLSTGIALGFN